MTLDELEAKLARATERSELGYYEEAEQLTNEVLADLHHHMEAQRGTDIRIDYPHHDATNPDRASVLQIYRVISFTSTRAWRKCSASRIPLLPWDSLC